MALAGGIIWYNLRKSTELMLASAEREMVETGEKISDRIKLLYDPLICDRRHRLSGARDQDTAQRQWPPSHGDLLRVLRFYPQILSLYVGLENGDFLG